MIGRPGNRATGPGPVPPECAAAREAMLVAEPAELAGVGDTDLTRHLESCAHCRGTARRLQEAAGALDEWLTAEGRGPDLERVLEEAGRPPPRARRTLVWMAPAALAAGIAALLLLGRGREPPGESARLAARSEGPGAVALDLEVPEGSDAAVFATADPDITVIWFMGGDR